MPAGQVLFIGPGLYFSAIAPCTPGPTLPPPHLCISWPLQMQPIPAFSLPVFPRQKYWSGVPFPSPGGLPDPGMESVSLAFTSRFFTTSTTWEAQLESIVMSF